MSSFVKTEFSRLKAKPGVLAMAMLLPSFHTHARDYFNPALLAQPGESSTTLDLSAFENGGQLPGPYPVDIYLNEEMMDSKTVTFIQSADKGLQPCLSVEMLKQYGVKVEHFPELLKPDASCIDFTDIPNGSAEFVFSAHRLNISIPQASVDTQARGYVPPSQWDEGINAAMLNYSVNGTSDLSQQRGNAGDSQYINLRPGINLGPWRLRNYSTWTRNAGGNESWDNVYTYAQRSIVPLRSQLTLGESQASSDVFDSVPFVGAQLASDDEMLPDSLRGYAPTVRGIARGNSAQVLIRQNGYLIYQATVPAGPFEITDMFPTGGSGDLNVTVKEVDGSEQHIVVPYASVPVLQREGHLRYSLTGGKYRSYTSHVERAPFTQGTAIYGLRAGMTLYSGLQLAEHYRSLAAGIGQNLGNLGAISADVTQSWSKTENETARQGQSWRLRYSKSMTETGTNVSLAGYRYSTSNYYSLADVLETYSDHPTLFNQRRRDRAELTLSQSLGNNLGYLSISAINERYWNDSRKTSSWNLGYNNSWHGIGYGLNYSMNRNTSSTSNAQTNRSRVYQRDSIVSFNVNVPLERWLTNSYATYNVSSSQSGGMVNTLGLNGTLLEDRNLSWNVSQGYTSGSQGNQGNSGYASMNYRATYGEISGGYSHASGQRTLNYGLQGSLIAHADGITAGQTVGETFGLVKVPGASGVSVNNQNGVRTDYRGYALVPNLMPYRNNDVTLSTESLQDDVDLQQTSKKVVPTRGAIVRADYRAQVGKRVLMNLYRADGSTVPFGATVVNETDPEASVSIVGDAGQVYLAGLQDKGMLLVQWGKDAYRQCRVSWHLNEMKKTESLQTINGQCR